MGPFCIGVAGLLGCAGTVQRTAKEAAPAAVEGAVEEAREPDTRADIAAILEDPAIRSAASALTAAILAGAMDGLADDARSARFMRRLLELNANGLLHAAFGISAGQVVLTAALELQNLDMNELEAVLADLDLALAEHVPGLISLSKNPG